PAPNITVISTALPAGYATCCGCGCGVCWPNADTALTQKSPITTAIAVSTLIARIIPSTKVSARPAAEQKLARSPHSAAVARCNTLQPLSPQLYSWLNSTLPIPATTGSKCLPEFSCRSLTSLPVGQ